VEAPGEVGMVVRTAAWVAAALAVWELAAAVKASWVFINLRMGFMHHLRP
jgi:hypothetical protein